MDPHSLSHTFKKAASVSGAQLRQEGGAVVATFRVLCGGEKLEYDPSIEEYKRPKYFLSPLPRFSFTSGTMKSIWKMDVAGPLSNVGENRIVSLRSNHKYPNDGKFIAIMCQNARSGVAGPRPEDRLFVLLSVHDNKTKLANNLEAGLKARNPPTAC